MLKRTSDRVSSIAARYVNFGAQDFPTTGERRAELARDIRSMSASLLAQDEVRGIRGRIRKLLQRATED
jgi:hypothetical protein